MAQTIDGNTSKNTTQSQATSPIFVNNTSPLATTVTKNPPLTPVTPTPVAQTVTPVMDAKGGNKNTPLSGVTPAPVVAPKVEAKKDVKVTTPKADTKTTANKSTVDTKTTTNKSTVDTKKTTTLTGPTKEQIFNQSQQDYAKQATEFMNAPNENFEKLKTMTFDYDVQSDPEYQRDAAGLENQIASMMVGRGGLYSSVASSALQSGLINLQLGKTQQKYQEYKEDRNFTMQLMEAERQANNDAFNKIMALKGAEFDKYKFDATVAQQKIDNDYRAMVYKAEQEERAYNRKIAEQNAITNQARLQAENNTRAAVVNLTKAYQVWDKNKVDYNKYLDAWFNAKDGKATPEIANKLSGILGFPIKVGAYIPDYAQELATFSAKLGQQEKDLNESAFALNQYDNFSKMIDSTNKTATENKTVVNYEYGDNDKVVKMTTTKN